MISDVGRFRRQRRTLVFVYDSRRVVPSGLAGRDRLAPTPEGDLVTQFDRTPTW